MLLEDILKMYRQKNGYTQRDVADKLYVSTQAVSKWENGQAMPSIDNLLGLSDLYGISLDELIQGSPFFKKTYLVGKKFHYQTGIVFVISWFLISCFFTGFGYQPFGLFMLIFLLGIFLVLPTLFGDYWVIEKEHLTLSQYSNQSLTKVLQLVFKQPPEIQISYSEIISLEIIHHPKMRLSPFDISPDIFYLKINHQKGEEILPLYQETKKFLPQFINFSKRQGILVIDECQVIDSLIANEELQSHSHS